MKFDAECDHWFAVIALTTGSFSYLPFVRLALCRYQPYALPESKTSRVVTADSLS